MVNYSLAAEPLLDATFGALSDPTRRAILARLALGEATVTELAAPFDVSLPAVSNISAFWSLPDCSAAKSTAAFTAAASLPSP